MSAPNARKKFPGRPRAILEAALACFTEVGYAATTVEGIRARSGASIGSIYHHFRGKEQIAAALYIEGLRDYQAGMLARLRRASNAKEGVSALVSFHLSWVERHSEWARFLLSMRHAEFMAEAEREVREANHAFLGKVRPWIEQHTAAGTLRRMPLDVYAAVLIGPAQEFSRHWLARRTHTSVRDARLRLAEAAWRAVRGETKRRVLTSERRIEKVNLRERSA